jgi:hypothetical protein
MSDGTVKLSLGELIGTASHLARVHFLALLVYIGALTVIGAGLDMLPRGGGTAGNIGSVIAGYFLYEHLLRKEGLMAAGRTERSIWSYVGVSILTGIAIALGFILLIVPGLILAARWSIATGIVVAEGRPATQAMSTSWAATRASQWSIVALYAIYGLAVFVPAILLGAGLGLFGALESESEIAFGSALLTNLFAQVFTAGGFVIGVALMQGLYRGTDELEAVFA